MRQREQYGKDALPIAGGQSFLVMLRNKLIDPKVLIDLEPLGELRGVQCQAEAVSIGAMTTIYNLLSSPEVRSGDSDTSPGGVQGGLDGDSQSGHDRRQPLPNEPGADLPPALLALNAAVELRSRKSNKKSSLAGIFSRLISKPLSLPMNCSRRRDSDSA